MNSQKSAKEALNVLDGRLWHTTKSERYQMILETGCILPNPLIPEEERWKTSGGPDVYHYVRRLGDVSLFDFERFDPERYSEKYPLSSWWTFVPYVRDWGQSIWIEIDKQFIIKVGFCVFIDALDITMPEKLFVA